MSTIATLTSNETGANSLTDINQNFSNLNADKFETSNIDTDTSLAANSDTKVASQKAVKTYIDTSGGANASTTVRGIVEEATVAEIAAGTAAGGTNARLFINPSSTVSTSAGSADVGKVPRLNASGLIDATMITKPTVASGMSQRDLSTANGSFTIAHGLSGTPRVIRLTVTLSSTTSFSYAVASYVASTLNAVNLAGDFGSGTGNRNGQELRTYSDAGGGVSSNWTVTVDGTNITIATSKTGSPTGTAQILWEAFQ